MSLLDFDKSRKRAPGRLLSPNFLMLTALFVVSGAGLFLGVGAGWPLVFLFVLSGWIVSLCLHEFGHAYVAYRGGDYTIPGKGYLELDPVRYVDPVTSLLMPVLFLLMGWLAFPGGSVYVDRSNLRGADWLSTVSLAGPAANLFFAIALLVPFWFGLPGQIGAKLFWGGVAFLIFLQIAAIFFNLIPLPGLDGYGIIEPYLPWQTQQKLEPLRRTGPLVLMLLFLFFPPFSAAFFKMVFALMTSLHVDMAYFRVGARAFQFWK